jgi:hypothetical protein
VTAGVVLFLWAAPGIVRAGLSFARCVEDFQSRLRKEPPNHRRTRAALREMHRRAVERRRAGR